MAPSVPAVSWLSTCCVVEGLLITPISQAEGPIYQTPCNELLSQEEEWSDDRISMWLEETEEHMSHLF